MSTIDQLLVFTAIPAALMALGSVLAFFKRPGEKSTSFIQHFAGGVVFAAVAVEIVPKIIQHEIRSMVCLGFFLGLLLMFLVDWVGDRASQNGTTENQWPIGLLFAVAVDVIIDGLLIGVSFIASTKSGVVIALALALEVLFLGLSTSAALVKSRAKVGISLFIMIGIALLIPVGAVVGYSVVAGLSRSVQMAILSFGVAALLYLVTEELLREAHEVEDTRFATSAFFIGFLIILLFA